MFTNGDPDSYSLFTKEDPDSWLPIGPVFIFTVGDPDLHYTMGIRVHINHGNLISRQNENDQKN